MEQLGTKLPGRVHSTKVKNRMLPYFPDMKAHTQGREVLVSNEDVSAALRKACEHDGDGDEVYPARAAMIVRRDYVPKKNGIQWFFPHSMSGAVCADFTSITSCYGTKRTKYQDTIKFFIIISASPQSVSASSIQQLQVLQGEC